MGFAVAAVLSLLATHATAATQFKIATIAPEGSQWMQAMRTAAKEIKAGTDERVIVKYYTGGVMGNDKKVLRKIRIGQLHGGAFTASGLAERYPDIVVYGLPLIFDSYDEVDYVREQMDPVLTAGLDDAGFVSFGFAGGGFASLMGNEQITQIDQLRGRKAWIPEGDRLSHVAMEALKLSPVLLPITDVLTGLQTGLIEFIASPPVAAVVLQWHTKVKYVTDVPLAYAIGVLAIDKRSFGRLSDADRTVFRDAMTRAYAQVDAQARPDNENAMEALRASGLNIIQLDAEQLAEWRAAASDASQALVEQEVISSGIYNRLIDHLQEFRAAGSGNEPTAAISR